LFHDIIASDGVRNLKGTKKLEAIRERVPGDFVYVGDNHADLPIWQAARAGILVGVSPGLARAVRRVTTVVGEFSSEPATIGTWLRALRVHQWLKNALIFVPLLTAFSFDQLDKLVAAGVAFLAFSLAASATYLLNDLWDLESDRAHPRKRHRPLASARIPILAGVGVAACALPVAMILAASVSPGFLTMLLLYVALTSAYSWKLKRIVLVDVVMLSLLYTLRIIAGAVAIGVTTSSWLLAFSVFTFFSLALVKRCSELVSLAQEGKEVVRGRDYGVGDLVVLWPLGVGAAMCSVVVFGLFISAPETQARYASPELLWFIAVALIYWLSRVWIKTSRGEMHDDPLVFAVRDRASGLTMFGIVLTTLVAHYVRISGA
jgi:4-hydroxybenzoate polyprenyltransferase